MRIIGFNLSKILVEKKEKFPEKLQISQNINIKEIQKEKIPISDEEALKIDFQFTVSYSESFANLEFHGNIILLPSKEQLKSFLKSWKEKEVPEDLRVPIFNFIMNKCNIKALSLEDELGLPLHIPMPRVAPGNEK